MNPLTFVYTEILFRPLLNLLVGITNTLPGHGVGWAIIIVTLIVRLVLLPSSLHQARRMKVQQDKMKAVQKEIAKMKKEHKDDKAKQSQETMRIYKENGINPAGGCLPLLIQLPILIALYRVFLAGLSPETYQFLYSFVVDPTGIQTVFFGINLNEPSLRLGVLAGIGQFIQMKWLAPSTPTTGDDDNAAAMMSSMQKNMAYIFPVMTVFIALRLPAALALYWAISTIFGIVQQYIVKRSMHLESVPPGV